MRGKCQHGYLLVGIGLGSACGEVPVGTSTETCVCCVILIRAC